MPRLNAKMIAAGLVAVGLLLGAVALVSADEECSDFQHTLHAPLDTVGRTPGASTNSQFQLTGLPTGHAKIHVERIANRTASKERRQVKVVGYATELSRTAAPRPAVTFRCRARGACARP